MTRSLLLNLCWAIHVIHLTHSVSLSRLIEELKLIELTLRSQEAALTFTRGKAEKRPCKNCPTGSGICTKCVTMARFSRDFCSSCHYNSEGGAVQSPVGARIRSVDRSQMWPRIWNGIIHISSLMFIYRKRTRYRPDRHCSNGSCWSRTLSRPRENL
jgi:hypothetical protein